MRIIAAALISLQVLLLGCSNVEEQKVQEQRQEQKEALVHVSTPTWLINFSLRHKETGELKGPFTAVVKGATQEEAVNYLKTAGGVTNDSPLEMVVDNVVKGVDVKTNTR